MTEYDALDDFAGPGGWDYGARLIGLATIGTERDAAACATAEAAGFKRRHVDVTLDPSDPYAGMPGHISSPPCTLFSTAGSGVGTLVLDVLTMAIRAIFRGDDVDQVRADARAAIYPVTWAHAVKVNDKRDAARRWSAEQLEVKAHRDALTASLVLEPARRIVELEPEWVALEQVPAAEPLWQEYARCLRTRGYSAWVAVLCAADYGVPQQRYRAVLGASRASRTAPPPPTHAEDPQGADLFGDALHPWVTMSEGLEWGYRDRPAPAVCAGTGGKQSGVEWGGARTRLAMLAAQGTPSWAHRRPATTIVGSFRPDIVAAPGYRLEVSRQNAPDSIAVTVPEAGVLQSFPCDYPWHGNLTKQFEQVGNAVPPLLAAHVLAAVTGRRPPHSEGGTT